MFKSVISSLNGVGGDSARPEDHKDSEPECKQQNGNSNQLGGHHQAAEKKGRRSKRFSSMMNKIHKVASMGGKRSPLGDHNYRRHASGAGGEPDDSSDDECERRPPSGGRGAYEHGHEDEDEDYKTAEEACRKMSLNEPAGGVPGKRYDAQSAKKAMESHKQQQHQHQRQHHHQRPSLAGSEKFLLPEELSDIPTFLHTQNCDRQLIDETRRLLKERYAKNPDSFYDADYERMLTDDWTVSRFLLRRRLDPKRTAKLMEECGRFRKQYKMSEVELWEFPIEFHKAGGLFQYARDRVGNVTMYMRVKMYRRVPEISDVFKAFILCVLERCDVANNGRGTAVIFDLSGCGLQNVDLGFLSWLLSSFRNYCPKGVSYILVYNLPWILNATCKLAMTWMSASNKRALRFVYGDEIENFVPRENLPDYMGGQCKLNYRRVPAGSLPATEVCHRFDLTPAQANKIADLFREYLDVEGVEYETEDEGREERLRRQQEKINKTPLEVGASRKAKTKATKASGKQTTTTTTTTTTRTNATTPYSEVTKALSEMSQAGAQEATDTAVPAASSNRALNLVSQATKFVAH